MCMQELHQSLREHHHLRHWGRQQYGLFLKGIGLSLEEALKFWRSEFTKLMDGDKVVVLSALEMDKNNAILRTVSAWLIM